MTSRLPMRLCKKKNPQTEKSLTFLLVYTNQRYKYWLVCFTCNFDIKMCNRWKTRTVYWHGRLVTQMRNDAAALQSLRHDRAIVRNWNGLINHLHSSSIVLRCVEAKTLIRMGKLFFATMTEWKHCGKVNWYEYTIFALLEVSGQLFEMKAVTNIWITKCQILNR